MLRVLKTILLTGLCFLLVVSSAYFYWQNKLLQQENRSLTAKLNKGKPPEMSLNDFYLYAQKTKALEQVVASSVYYTTRVSKLSDSQVQVDFYLLGGERMKVDAADLSFNLDPNLELVQLNKGETFQNYPRLVKTNNHATVTGIASITGNSVLLGEVNKIFLSAIIKKINPELSSRLTIDFENTKAYLQGEPILNLVATIKDLQL